MTLLPIFPHQTASTLMLYVLIVSGVSTVNCDAEEPDSTDKVVTSQKASPSSTTKRPIRRIRHEDIHGPTRTQNIDLRQCYLLALSNNLDLEIAGIDPRILLTQVRESRASRDPLLNFSISRTRSKSQTGSSLSGASLLISDTNSGSLGISKTSWLGTSYSLSFGYSRTHTNNSFTTLNPAYNSDMTFTISQPLLRNFGFEQNRSTLKQTILQHQQSLFDFQKSALDVLQEVENKYWDLVFTHADLQFKKDSVTLAKDLLRITRIRKRVGEVTRIEELEAEAGVASAEQTLILAVKALSQAQDDLKRLIHPHDMSFLWNVTLLPMAEIPITVPTVPDHPVDELASINRALAWRPSILRLRQQVEISTLAAEEARGLLLPKLDLEGSVKVHGKAGDRDEAFDDNKSGRFFDWSASLTLEIPIGNRVARNQYQRTMYQRQQAQSQVHSAERTLIHEVRTAIRDVTSATRQINAAKKVTRFNRDTYEAEKKRFQVGQSTLFRIDEFREKYTQARTSEVSSYINYRKALAQLKRSEGSSLSSLEELGIDLKTSR